MPVHSDCLHSPTFNTWPPCPPANESELDRALRFEEEQEAKQISDAIDVALELEKQEKRKRRETKILLLGQAESGKSTILKQFQLYYTPKAFQAEAEAWKAVIHLNLVRSVNFILDIVSGSTSDITHGKDSAATYVSTSAAYRSSQSNWSTVTGGSEVIRSMRMRLSPLRQVEVILVKKLSAADSHRAPSLHAPILDEATPWYYGRASEVTVRGGSAWKALLKRRRITRGHGTMQDDLDKARQILDACKDDIAALWLDEQVQAGLRREGVYLQDQSGFFLDDAVRIASIDYEPTIQDILKARLQTIGVEEHALIMESGVDNISSLESGQTWLFYDVGGSKGQRAAWAPYFDDVNAMIFLSSIAAFNQVLLEDRTVNRLLDSFTLWKSICSSRLLLHVTFILLMNKCDLLDAKLKSGEQFVRYVKSYKNGSNDLEHVAEYLKNKFTAIHRSQHGRKRHLHVHMTTAIDIKVMKQVLVRIREAILVDNLEATDLL